MHGAHGTLAATGPRCQVGRSVGWDGMHLYTFILTNIKHLGLPKYIQSAADARVSFIPACLLKSFQCRAGEWMRGASGCQLFSGSWGWVGPDRRVPNPQHGAISDQRGSVCVCVFVCVGGACGVCALGVVHVLFDAH